MKVGEVQYQPKAGGMLSGISGAWQQPRLTPI